jgi:hypothetical protein
VLAEPENPNLYTLNAGALAHVRTWSASTAAGVLGRGEYAAVFTRSKPTSRTSATVRWNCSSVSPESS